MAPAPAVHPKPADGVEEGPYPATTTMAKKFDELRQKMSPERQRRSEAKANRILAGLTAGASHTITILHTEGCLGAPEAEKLARSLAVDHDHITVEVMRVADQHQAAALGFRGSPTVLIDGEDIEPDSGIPLGTMA